MEGYYMSLVFEDCMRVGCSTSFARCVMKTAHLKEAKISQLGSESSTELESDLLHGQHPVHQDGENTTVNEVYSDIMKYISDIIFTISTDSPEKLFIKNYHNLGSLRAPHTIFLVMELIRGGLNEWILNGKSHLSLPDQKWCRFVDLWMYIY